MLRESFTEKKTGTLQKLTGEYQSRYGLIHYETYSFTPDPLGDEYPELSQKAVGAITRASMALARLSELGDGIPNPDLLRRPTMRREAQSTSALEGTYERIETVLAQDYEPGGDKTGWNESLGRGVQLPRRRRSRASEACGRGAPSGSASRANSNGSSWPTPNPTVRRPAKSATARCSSDRPPAGSRTPASCPCRPDRTSDIAVRALMDWWNSRNEPGLAVLDMAMFHYQFETMHPFTDGNGRIGRLLILLQMMSRGLLSQPLLSVSPWFEQRRPDYQDRLLEVSTRGDWEGWLLFFCQGIEESCEDALLRVKRLNNLRDRYRRLVADHRYGATTMNAAMTFIGQPYTTAPILSRAVGKSYTATRGALANLESLGIVKAVKGGSSIGYMAEDVMLAVSAAAGHAVEPDAPLLSETRGD